MKNPNLPRLLKLIEKVSIDSSKKILMGGSNEQRTGVDLPRDIKVKADRDLDVFITEKIIEFSSYQILSEESGLLESGVDSSFRWIIDPLDGSLNFSRGIPISCISISLWKGMNPILGVVYDFNRNETFSGLVGSGAWLNGNPIKTGEQTETSRAILCTGFPVNTNFSRESLLDFVEKIKKYKKIRLFGSAALSLAYVACGRADVYMENDIKIWDVAGGIALVKAAGGTIKMQPSIKENALLVEAANENLLDAVE